MSEYTYISESEGNKKYNHLCSNMSTTKSTFMTENMTDRESSMMDSRLFMSEKVNINSFKEIKVIGRGSYARVKLVQKTDTNEYFAMKTLKKGKIQTEKSKSRVKMERDIIMNIKHPFIVNLHYSFQTEDKLYFILDYLNGGDLFTHIIKDGKFNEKRARFYTAQMVLALNHLHENNVVYRDLKPQNIIIDKQGNAKLTDFGLSKIGFDESQSNTI